MRLNLRPWLLSGVSLALLMAVAVSPALAGTASIAWDPVSATDLAGYRVFVGPSAGSYAQQSDVASTVTTHTVSGLADCTTHFIAVKAFDTVGNPYAATTFELPRRIDYVFVRGPELGTGRGKPLSCEVVMDELVDGIAPSDHYGVLAEISLVEAGRRFE